jgi:predicted ATPase
VHPAGRPLAIELAAARCSTLGPEQLAARLDGHPGLLAGGPARPDRHRSLEALVAWSYDLLDEPERSLLTRLSVLRGGFDLELAERVGEGEALTPLAIAALLASLADKSVVQVRGGVRYSLLETIRQFAAGRLAASGEQMAVHARFAHDGIACAQQADQGQLEIWGRTLLGALAWQAGDAARVRALLEHSADRLEQADQALAGRAHPLLANAAFLSGDFAEQQRHGQRAIELARAAAGQEGLALALTAWTVSAIAGAGIGPGTQAALDEALTAETAQADRFTETITHHWRSFPTSSPSWVSPPGAELAARAASRGQR